MPPWRHTRGTSAVQKNAEMWSGRRVSRELRPGELLVCQVVGAALIVMVCGFFLGGAIASLSKPRQFAGNPQEPAHTATSASTYRKQPRQSVLGTEPSRRPAAGASPEDSLATTVGDEKVLSEAALKARGLEIALRAAPQALESYREASNPEPGVTPSKPVRTQTFQPASEQKIATGKFASAEPHSVERALEKEPATAPAATSFTDEDLRPVQSRLRDLGFLSSAGKGTCDAACKGAVQDFKVANRLANNDVLDSQTREQLNSPQAVRANQSFVGNWCRPADKKTVRLSISSRRAKSSAGSVCVFHNMHAENGGWRVRATCSEGDQSWNANGKITLASGKLVWASERDVVSYSRCK
jgi:hypothetical protein